MGRVPVGDGLRGRGGRGRDDGCDGGAVGEGEGVGFAHGARGGGGLGGGLEGLGDFDDDGGVDCFFGGAGSCCWRGCGVVDGVRRV